MTRGLPAFCNIKVNELERHIPETKTLLYPVSIQEPLSNAVVEVEAERWLDTFLSAYKGSQGLAIQSWHDVTMNADGGYGSLS